MEKKEIRLILSMLVMIVSCCEGINEYDYLQVVIQWQPATCSDSGLRHPCYRDPDNKFSIHGMWPSLYKGRTSCSGSSFDPQIISMFMPEICEIWPNVATGDHQWLWGHEWDKHGTCTESTLFKKQEQYFRFTMDKYNAHDLLDILQKSQITPNGQTYSKDQIYKAIRASTGKTPAVRCNDNLSGISQLHEISLCYNKDATAYEDCHEKANKCGQTFVWNAWTTANVLSI